MVSISEKGARFKSYYDCSIKSLTPELSIEIQRQLGADLVVVLGGWAGRGFYRSRRVRFCRVPLASLAVNKKCHCSADVGGTEFVILLLVALVCCWLKEDGARDVFRCSRRSIHFVSRNSTVQYESALERSTNLCSCFVVS